MLLPDPCAHPLLPAALLQADTQDWGVDYGPARPLQQQHGEGYYPA